MQRNYLSGAAKRKLKQAQDLQKKRLIGSITKFTTVLPKPSENRNVEPETLPSVNKDNVISLEVKNILEEIEDSTPERRIGKENNIEECFLNSDPATWNTITDAMIDYFLSNPPPQNKEKLSETGKVIAGCKRFLTNNSFYRIKNDKKIPRDWLVLSESKKSLFCWICKLFNTNAKSSSNLSTCGFDDWKHAAARLEEHENSFPHRDSILKFSSRMKLSQRVDSSLVLQYQTEAHYWRSVLHRVIATVKFLSLRGLAFFGENETIGSTHNGNFLGCLELLSQFDPFLAGHPEKYGNCGSGSTNYLSSTCINEFINLMGKEVLHKITEEVITAKYFSIIVDSTPDITHLDQLCFILRYISPDREPVERFVKFIPIYGHCSEYLTNVVIDTIENMGLSMQNITGQSYDNASNMAGKYSGLQARIKKINQLADFVPCSAHSLNLIGVNAAESSTTVTNFFCTLQGLYNFFSASTHRWQMLQGNGSEQNQILTLKNRSHTRWCADADATKVLRKNYQCIKNTLYQLSENAAETPSTRTEARALHKKLSKFETAINTVVWDVILQRLNQTSKILQKSTGSLEQVPTLFHSLIQFIQFIRKNFELYEKEALEILPDSTYDISRKKSTPRSRLLDDSATPEVILTPRENFIVTCHYVLCDSLISDLASRKIPYETLTKKFSCLFNMKSSTLHKDAKYLQQCYPSELDKEFSDEIKQFSSIVDDNETVLGMLKKLDDPHLSSAFVNVDIALKLFLTFPISNCSGERSFSLLKRLKSPLRSYLQQNKLSHLSILCLNNDITNNLDYNELINKFAECKIRRKSIKI